MTNTKISFQKEKNGYDRQEVDNYIEQLSDAYQRAYDEYLEVSGMYESLLEERELASGMSPDTAAKTLISTEKLAQKIIEEAQAEAAAAVAEAEKARADAILEAAKAEEYVRRILEDANMEAENAAAHTQKSLAQARKIIEQAASQVELSFAYFSAQEPGRPLALADAVA